MMRLYGGGSLRREIGRRPESIEDIVAGGNGNPIMERCCRWMDLITIGLRAEAPGVC